jgi:hypothetical protein
MNTRCFYCLLILMVLYALPESEAQVSLQDFQQEETARILKVMQQHIDSLGLKATRTATSSLLTLLHSPVQESAQNKYFLSTLISSFADHDPVYGALQDYNCGTRTYDNTSGGHSGTDMTINPFKWKLMDDRMVQVVAAATGVIVFKEDGHYDRNYNAPDSAANSVIVWHPGDGSKALYLHLKKFSLTTKNVGDTIYAGEFIGFIGSSGVSTGPHLHFEIRDSSNTPVDPFFGPCNAGIQSSWWTQQHPYYDTDILSITTHTRLVDWGNNLNDAEITWESDQFSPGDSIKFYSYLRSFFPGDTFQLKVFRPDGTLFYGPSKGGASQFYSSYYMYRSSKLPSNATQGVWRAEGTLVSSNAQVGTITRNKYFCVGQTPQPAASFSTSVSGLTVTCQNTSQQAYSYVWLFGNGSYSKQINPVYTYPQHGQYNLCLVASNGCETDTFCAGVTTGMPPVPVQSSIRIWPNPAAESATISFNSTEFTNAKVRLFNACGQMLQDVSIEKAAPGEFRIDLSTLAPGLYLVQLSSRSATLTLKLLVERYLN